MSDLTKNILVFVVVAVVMMSVFQNLGGLATGQTQRQDYSDFLGQVRTGQVERVEFQGDKITYGSREPLSFSPAPKSIAGYIAPRKIKTTRK